MRSAAGEEAASGRPRRLGMALVVLLVAAAFSAQLLRGVCPVP